MAWGFGAYHYVAGSPDVHVLFGWVQIAQRVPLIDRLAIPRWALDHPHCTARTYGPANTLYLSTDRLTIPGIPLDLPGADIFHRFHPALCLTAPGESRSVWRLPGWFYSTVLRGQEFVLDCREYPEAPVWLADLFCSVLRVGSIPMDTGWSLRSEDDEPDEL